jgi:CheY-like chemotaxis protein
VNTTAAVALKTVLVADDTAFVRDRFKAALETAGHRALTARTGPEVLSAFREHGTSVDLIVLDLRLPQANGVALLRALRKLSTSLPPVVVFSGTIASADEVRELAALEVAGYLNEYTAVQHIVPSLTPHLFPGEYNRRSSPRVVLGVPIAYRFANTIATSLTLNISRGPRPRRASPGPIHESAWACSSPRWIRRRRPPSTSSSRRTSSRIAKRRHRATCWWFLRSA